MLSFVIGYNLRRTRGGALGWGTALQSRKIVGSIPDGVTEIFL
jgi:hypothetical protein